jgi:hypothetical protein
MGCLQKEVCFVEWSPEGGLFCEVVSRRRFVLWSGLQKEVCFVEWSPEGGLFCGVVSRRSLFCGVSSRRCFEVLLEEEYFFRVAVAQKSKNDGSRYLRPSGGGNFVFRGNGCQLVVGATSRNA